MTNPASGAKWKTGTKIYQFSANPLTYPGCDFIIGFAGGVEDMVTTAEFFSEPDSFRDKLPAKGLVGLVLTAKKDIFMFTNPRKWLKIITPYAAIGSGAEYAMGAICAGKTPREAVKIASQYDSFTGMGIKTLKF